MSDLNSFKLRITDMSKLALEMWHMTFETFMEHDLDLMTKVLQKENKLNDLEKEIDASLIEFARASSSKEEKSQAGIYLIVVEDLEIIGDYCSDILERIQVKVQEALLFSDEAVEEYTGLYKKTEKALDNIVTALDKNSKARLQDVIKQESAISNLVDEYRTRHNQRMIDGICNPMACNMFINMLDFTEAVYHHTKKIAQNLEKIKP